VQNFLHRFGAIVLGVLKGFDRLVFRGKLRQLYSKEGMHCYLSANHVLRKDFKEHAKEVTAEVLQASLVKQANKAGRFQYLGSSKTSKDEVARAIADKHPVQEGLVCVLQCVEPCWTFDLHKKDGLLTIRGERGKCSNLYHYFIHPHFGWMYARLQTWFPFEMQIYLNGREWLARQMDREGLKYRRSDNKFLWVEDWQRAQELLDEQLQTSWPRVLDAIQAQVHPLHPGHLGRLPVAYNWTVHQSEWATDVALDKQANLERFYDRWVRHAFLNFDSAQIMRFLGRSGRVFDNGSAVQTDLERFYEGTCLKHWVNSNSLKMYNHLNVLRVETTINEPKGFRVYRTKENDPAGEKDWRVLRRSVADVHRRSQVSASANERYLEALADVAETKTVKELVEPLCRRVKEPGKNSQRLVRGLNPLSAEDRALLTIISDPKWMVNGIRNRDLVSALYTTETDETKEQRCRSARATRLIRLLRAHGLLHKVKNRHLYQVTPSARTSILALLAACDANPDELMSKAA
jgi:hypothetical protein